jgi:hypothetical protein
VLKLLAPLLIFSVLPEAPPGGHSWRSLGRHKGTDMITYSGEEK